MVNYHIRSAAEQAIRFDVDGLAGNLVSPELVATKVAVQDLRGDTQRIDVDHDGITFARAATNVVDFDSSTDRRGQIPGVAANDAHEWFHLSAMNPDEAAIFNIYNNTGCSYLAHSALDLVSDTHAITRPRKSIESRTLVRY